MFGGQDHDFDVGGGGFEFELELGHSASEIVEGDQRQDCDCETAHGRDECFADAAGDLAGGTFDACVADGQEYSINSGDGPKQAQQRGESDKGVHDGKEAAGLLKFSAGSNLQSALQRGMEVIHAVPNHSDDGVVRIFGKPCGLGEIAIFERGKNFFESLRVAFAALAPPPKDALADDGDGEKSRDKNWPHDGAALLESLNEYVC